MAKKLFQLSYTLSFEYFCENAQVLPSYVDIEEHKNFKLNIKFYWLPEELTCKYIKCIKVIYAQIRFFSKYLNLTDMICLKNIFLVLYIILSNIHSLY